MSSSNQDKQSINFQGSKPRFFNKKKDGEQPSGGSQYAFRTKKADKNSDSSSQRQYSAADDKPIKSTGSHKSGLNVKAKPFSKAEFQRNSMGSPRSLPFKQDSSDQYRKKIQTQSSAQRRLEEDDIDIGELEQVADSPMPIVTPEDGQFSSFPEIHKRTVENLTAKGYVNLFPIQQHCFYPVYQRHDLIARDLTGSGKTFAFGLPITEYLRRQKLLGQRRIQAIVLAPTRELALQVTNELTKLKHIENEFKILTVYGGVSIDDQTRQLRQGVDILVGTTGRVLDHIERGHINFSDLKSVVLDEADIMLKLGFKEDVDNILASIQKASAKDVQLLLFSATIPAWVRNIARSYMKRGFKIVDLAQDLKNKTARQVNHLAIECPYHNRVAALADVLICYGGNAKTIVFTQTKQDANQLILAEKIKQDMEVMHGDIAQNQREVTIKRFKEGKFQVLVATDVASRGLDIPNVDLVIQIEPPKDTETYIHRSGRTARAGKSGTCITFYMRKTFELIQKIEDQAGIKLKRVGIPQAEDIIKASSSGILKNLRDVNEDVLHLFEDLAKVLIDQHDGNAEKALQVALAYCSGHYKQKLASKSLLTGQEGQTTVQMSVQKGRLGPSNCYSILKKFWDPRTTDQVRNMKAFKNGLGVVFDIRANALDAFLENFNRLKETGDRIDFEVEKCQALPELEEEGPSGGNWRDQGRDQGYDRGYGGHRDNGFGGYQSRGPRGGHSGGYGKFRSDGRDYHDRDGGPSGGWGRSKGGHVWSNRDRDYDDDDSYGNEKQSWGRNTDSYQRRDYGGKGYDGGHSGGFGKRSDVRPKTAAQAASGSGPNVQMIGQKPKSGGSQSIVYVSNLKYQANEQDLLEFFKSYDFDPLRARLLYDNEGNSKGTGFVELKNSGEAQSAVDKLQGEYCQGRPVKVTLAGNKN